MERVLRTNPREPQFPGRPQCIIKKKSGHIIITRVLFLTVLQLDVRHQSPTAAAWRADPNAGRKGFAPERRQWELEANGSEGPVQVHRQAGIVWLRAACQTVYSPWVCASERDAGSIPTWGHTVKKNLSCWSSIGDILVSSSPFTRQDLCIPGRARERSYTHLFSHSVVSANQVVRRYFKGCSGHGPHGAVSNRLTMVDFFFFLNKLRLHLLNVGVWKVNERIAGSVGHLKPRKTEGWKAPNVLCRILASW